MASILRSEEENWLPPCEAEKYISLLERTADGMSDENFLVFAFRFLLGREPDPSGFTSYMADLVGGVLRAQLLRTVMLSQEFKSRPGLPSPFDGSFPEPPVFAPIS